MSRDAAAAPPPSAHPFVGMSGPVMSQRIETANSPANATALPQARARVMAAVAAGLLGLVLVWGVGFASPAAVHNAAHDSRHALVFPCH